MLRWRLLLGTVFVVCLAGLAWLDLHAPLPGEFLWPLAVATSLLGCQECLSLFAARQLRPPAGATYLGTLLIVGSTGGGVFWPAHIDPLETASLAFPLAVMGAFVVEMVRYREPGEVMIRVGLAVLTIAYVGLFMAFVIQLRVIDAQRGMVALASLLIVVKMCDIGAYTVGRLWGRHKMAPHLSPGKTLEGVAGGLAFACLGAWLSLVVLGSYLAPEATVPSIGAWMVYGLIVGVAGIVGDLAESLLKRDMGRKDSSTWMPGFGGVLDLLDSILLAAPVAYLCWRSGLLGD